MVPDVTRVSLRDLFNSMKERIAYSSSRLGLPCQLIIQKRPDFVVLFLSDSFKLYGYAGNTEAHLEAERPQTELLIC